MQWRDAVLAALRRYSDRRHTKIIERQQFIAEELPAIIDVTRSRGATPAQTLSRVLQQLRDESLVEFLSAGRYLLMDQPINAEVEDLPDEALDLAIRANRLKLGLVTTGTREALVRQRRGQDRVRSLTLENYRARCAVCDVIDQALLIASHILAWAEARDHRGDLSNVLCLCRFHDILFERRFWSLDRDYRVLRQTDIESRTVRLLLDAISGFRVPIHHPPDNRFLQVHRARSGLCG
jgi:hypothetical protein